MDQLYEIGPTLTRDDQRRWRIVFAWTAALLIALLLDWPVARAVAPWRVTVKNSAFFREVREGGHAGSTVVIVLLLVVLHPRKWHAATLVAGSAILAGLARACIAVATGRVRPVVGIHPFTFFHFNGGLHDVLYARNLSFPSGHATLAFVTAAALSHVLGRGAWLFFAGAALVGIERVAESAHYVSDIVAGALLGVTVFRIARRIHEHLWNHVTSGAAYPVSSA